MEVNLKRNKTRGKLVHNQPNRLINRWGGIGTPLIINGDTFEFWKKMLNDNTLNSDIWGTEFADGATDWNASNFYLQVQSHWDTDKSRLKDILVGNNGEDFWSDSIVRYFISSESTKKPHHHPNALGIRGIGTLLTILRVGFLRRIISRDKDGKLFQFEFFNCSDEMGQNKVDYTSHKDYQRNCGSVRIETKYIEDWEIGTFDTLNQGVKFELRWFEDSLLNFDHGAIERHLSKRYGQASLNININNSLIRPTYFGLDKSDNLIGDITGQFTYAGERVFEYGEEKIKVKLYWNTQIGVKRDSIRYNLFKDKLSARNGIEYRLKDSNKDWPSILLMTHTNIIFGEKKKGFIFGKGKPLGSYNDNMGNLQIAVQFQSQIKDYLASNKSNGFSDDNFEEKFGNFVSQWILDENIKPDYYHWSSKLEDNEMKQMVEKILEDNSSTEMVIRIMVGTKKEITHNKKNWRYVGDESNNQSNTDLTINDVTRQIDAINEKAGIIWEHETATSTIDHKDGIESRITNWCLKPNWIKHYFWSASKHGHKEKLIQTLRTFNWQNPSLERIWLIKKDDILQGTIDYDEVDFIDIKQDVLEHIQS